MWASDWTNGSKQPPLARPSEEAILIRCFFVTIPGERSIPSTPMPMTSSKKSRTLSRIGAVKERGVGGDAEAALHGFLDAFDGYVVSAFAANGDVVRLALSVEMHGKRQVL